MEENWDDDAGDSAVPVNGNGESSGSSWQPKESTQDNNSGGGWKPKGGFSGGGGGGGGGQNGEDGSESGGGWKPRGGSRGGYSNRRQDGDSGDGWKPRGGGGGFGGGGRYNSRRDEEGNDGSGGGWKPRGGGGGYNSRRDEEGNEGSGGGGGGGWVPRGGGSRGRGRRDDGDSQESGGGFRPRGGGRGRFQDENSEGGGWQPRGNGRSNFRNGDDGGEEGGESEYKPYGGGRGRGRGGRSFGEEDGDGGYRRGRGGRGRSFGDRDGEDGGRGGGGRSFGDGEREGEEGEKRQPLYIPKEQPDDEETMFKATHSGINFEKYESIEVKVSGENIPPKINAFEESGLRQFLLDNVKKSKYLTPTPVQKHALPIIMAKRDLMACAQTGSGKTAAFLLPIVENLMAGDLEGTSFKQAQEPYAVILAPTRELALQIFEEARKFTHGTIIKSRVAYGGVSVGYQLRQLESGCHILVATPGRMHDFIERGKLSFAKLKYLVLDEADRMLDTGFRPQVEKVAEMSQGSEDEERHTLMFSATFPKDVQELARKLLKQDYIFLAVGMVGGANTDVEQSLVQVDKFKKLDKLIEILDQDEDRVLVFVETKRNADFVAMRLCQKFIKTTSIHGDRFQEQREDALRTFRTGEMKILVATSVAARGLDIPDVRHVVNYDLPNNIEEYVHRIGRTGRVGNTGRATSFYDSQSDSKIAADLVKVLSDARQVVPDWLEADMSSGGYGSSAPTSAFGGSDVRGFRAGTEMTHVDSRDQWGTETAAQPSGIEEVEEDWG